MAYDAMPMIGHAYRCGVRHDVPVRRCIRRLRWMINDCIRRRAAPTAVVGARYIARATVAADAPPIGDEYGCRQHMWCPHALYSWFALGGRWIAWAQPFLVHSPASHSSVARMAVWWPGR